MLYEVITDHQCAGRGRRHGLSHDGRWRADRLPQRAPQLGTSGPCVTTRSQPERGPAGVDQRVPDAARRCARRAPQCREVDTLQCADRYARCARRRRTRAHARSQVRLLV